MIKCIVSGAKGRMGVKIISEILKQDDIEVVGALCRPGDSAVGTRNTHGVPFADSLSELETDRAILVEFSTPQAAIAHLEQALCIGMPVVIGTTGFTEEQEKFILEASQRIPIIESHNYGIGMNAFWEILKVAVGYLGDDYDIEVVEFHSAEKPDVPSGTGKTIVQLLADARADDFDNVVRYGREQDRKFHRKRHEIGIHSLRAGSYRSDHTVIFAGNGERLEFTHREEDQAIIARGVMWAMRYLEGRDAALYGMQDVLGFMRKSAGVDHHSIL